MDALAALLDGPRAREAFLLRSVMRSPWSLRVLAESPLTVLAVARGTIWIVPDEGEAVRLDAGDVAVTHGSGHYSVGDDPATPPSIVIHPGQRCESLDGTPLEQPLSHGVRTWGNDPEGSDVMLVGAYEAMSEVSDRLLRALPPVLSLARDEWECALIPVLQEEVVRDRPGQTAVLDRLLDLLLVAFLRAWLARPEAEAPGWYRAQSDPVVGRALGLMQQHPDRAWTLESLA
ncbi:MAG: cupin domain-containing protein, partial [Miltoncostaeaceae bacterium]